MLYMVLKNIMVIDLWKMVLYNSKVGYLYEAEEQCELVRYNYERYRVVNNEETGFTL